jgi:hypothetical protein
VTTPDRPHDPDDEPTGSAHDDGSGGVSADEAAWRSIIDNYGERLELPDDEPVDVPPSPRGVFPDEHAETPEEVEPGDHFVPPPPPPLPRPEPRRLVAWLGLFGVPTFVLVALVAGLDLPSWLGLILMVWFVGGFVYLVASMRPSAGDGYDDGAVL